VNMLNTLLVVLSSLPQWIWLFLFTLVIIFTINHLFKPATSALWLQHENTFKDPNNSNVRKPFPSTSTPPSVDISFITPAYDEQERISLMVDATLAYVKKRKQNEPSFTYELLIVDDGSRDNTSEVAMQYVKKETIDTVRLLKLTKNRGKGGAVKRGMLCARGKYMLMVDADGATEISDIRRLEEDLHKAERDGFGVAVGSRAHIVGDVVAKRTFVRNILMYGFHIFVQVLGVKGIKDTQCGFKLFTRKAAHALFDNLHIERWAFDVELLYRAQLLKIPVVEVAVKWQEIPGSKLSPFASSVQMAIDLTRIRIAYMLGFWKVNKPKAS